MLLHALQTRASGVLLHALQTRASGGIPKPVNILIGRM